MKLLALDLGDQWIGIAMSDELGLMAFPQETSETKNLTKTLEQLFSKHKISTIIVGYPLTMRGTKSEQTEKIVKTKEKLEALFPNKQFILWDERLTSKQAEQLKRAKTKEEKKKSHSIAAAFILDSYLQYGKTY